MLEEGLPTLSLIAQPLQPALHGMHLREGPSGRESRVHTGLQECRHPVVFFDWTWYLDLVSASGVLPHGCLAGSAHSGVPILCPYCAYYVSIVCL